MAVARARSEGQDGFTLIEMVVAIGLAAFVFAILAGVMASSIKTIAVQKGRTRANEIATQGIEDLQRYEFDSLGTCPASRAASPPAGMTDVVTLSNCPGSVTSAFGDPCAATAPSATNDALIPKGVYTCARSGTDPVTYSVRRYIAWADTAHTAKRLAVFVEWTDQAGNHQVSQQSSLRAPDAGSAVGLGPPALANPSVIVVSSDGDTVVNLTGDPGQLHGTERIVFDVTSLNNSSGTPPPDSVFVSFRTLDHTNAFAPTERSLFLTPTQLAGAWHWVGELNASHGHFFGAGTQVFTFGIVRDNDGKTNTIVGPTAVSLCPNGSCGGLSIPAFGAPNPMPVVADIAPGAGFLEGDVVFTITTTHLTAGGTVTLTVPTTTGTVSLVANHNDTCTLSGTTTTCTWTVNVPRAAGYTFESATPQTWYLTASQAAGGTVEEHGSTQVQSLSVTIT